MKKMLFMLLIGAAFASMADEQVKFSVRGAVKVDDLVFPVTFYDKKWHAYSQNMGYTRKMIQLVKQKSGQMDFVLNMPNLPDGVMTAALEKLPDNRFRYHAVVKFNAPPSWQGAALTLNLPCRIHAGQKIMVDKKPLILPPEYKSGKSNQIFRNRSVSELLFPAGNSLVKVEGSGLKVKVQDNRAYKSDNYSLRIYFPPLKKGKNETELDLVFSRIDFSAVPLDLRPAVNMGFTDSKAGDGQGGWTDQGAENDLRMIPAGRHRWFGVEFQIINPRRNHGKSCIMLAGAARNYFPKQAGCSLSGSSHGKFLYLLHARAWKTKDRNVGTVKLSYKDGTNTTIRVTEGVDVGNWWNPSPLDNGDVVWTSENRTSTIGLYRSCYPIEDKPLSAIEFSSAGNVVWGIVAASLGNVDVPRRRGIPFTIVAGRDWRPVDYYKDVVPQSALDFSDTLDKPAGKYGPAIIKNGKIVFRERQDRNMVFYGTNVCSSAPYVDKVWAERLATRLAAYGFNAVRLHHHDGGMVKKSRTTELDPKRIEQLDYLIYCFKQHGLYITTDLYVSRRLPAGEIPEYSGRLGDIREYKGMFWILDSVFENWKAYCSAYLNHINPYTKLAIKDDPALISVNLLNEDNIYSCWNATPMVAGLYNKRFNSWLGSRRQKINSRQERKVLFSQFLRETYNRRYTQMVEFVRAQGLKCMLSDQNMGSSPMLSVLRNQCDYVDNHAYWAHPSFPNKSWALPSLHNQRSALGSPPAYTPGQLLSSRIFGKPFTVTEFDYAKPNRFRAEGPVIMAVTAAVQDWDALFQFAYSHGQNNFMKDNATSNHFDLATDVIKHYAHRLGAGLFRSRDIAPAPAKVAILLDGASDMTFEQIYPVELYDFCIMAQVGTIISPTGRIPADLAGVINIGSNFPAYSGKLPVIRTGKDSAVKQMISQGIIPKTSFYVGSNTMKSANGQVFWDRGRQILKVTSPTCEVAILPEKNVAKTGFMTIRNKYGRAVFGVLSRDGKPLARSTRLVLFHLTNALPFKMKFAGTDMARLESWGTTPFMAQRGEAEVSLYPEAGANLRVYALNSAGKRLEKIPAVRQGDGGIVVKLKTFCKSGSIFAYELLRTD